MSKANYIQYSTDQIFMASTTAGQATSTALSTTQTGFTLTNPIGSGVTAVLLFVNGALTTAPAGIATVVLAANVNPNAAAVTQTTPLVVRSAKLGNATAANCLAASAATLPAAPVVVMGLGGPVATGSVSQPQIFCELNGALAIEPGCAISLNSLTTAISGVWSMVWAEVPQI